MFIAPHLIENGGDNQDESDGNDDREGNDENDENKWWKSWNWWKWCCFCCRCLTTMITIMANTVSFCVCAACRGQLELVHGSFLAIVVADSTTWNLGIQTQPWKFGDPKTLEDKTHHNMLISNTKCWKSQSALRFWTLARRFFRSRWQWTFHLWMLWTIMWELLATQHAAKLVCWTNVVLV